MEAICNSLSDDSDGHFFGSDGTCIARYTDVRDTWDKVYEICESKAPDGLLGRLVHIRTQDVLDWMDAEWSGAGHFWVGARALTGPTTTTFEPAEWFWYNDVATPGPNLAGLSYRINIHVSATDTCLKMDGSGSLENTQCSGPRRCFCQYLSKCRKCSLLLTVM